MLIGFLIITGHFLAAQNAITNKDVIAMKAAKVSEDLIIAKISSGNCDFNLNTQALVDLKIAKISDKVVKQMITASPPKETITNDDIINMDIGKISDNVIKEIINAAPHSFDTSPDGLIKLNTAKVPKGIIKEMMANPEKRNEQLAKKVNEEKSETPKSDTKTVSEPKKKGTPQPANSKICKPIETTDLETNEKYLLYGNTFNSGGVLGAIAGNADNSKEMVSVFGGFYGDKTVMLFQMHKIVGENWRNKTNLKDMYIKKGEKIIVVTSNGNMPFYTMGESRSMYKNELSGLSGSQERVSISAICLASKAQIEKLANSDIKEILFVITNGNTSTIRPSKGEKKVFTEKINCLIATEKYQNSPDNPVMEMSSDEAIAELKKAKDKYDLGLITKQEYEKIREDLKRYIK